MPIPIEVMRELLANPIARQLIASPHIMRYLNDNPQDCELLMIDAVNAVPIIEIQANLAQEDRQRVIQAAATAAAAQAAVHQHAVAAAAPQAAPAADPNQAVFARSVISIIRDTMNEMLVSRNPDQTPIWGGRLVILLSSPRVPFGVGPITDSVSAIQGEMMKEMPDLFREIAANAGHWPHPTSRSTLQIYHHLARHWARRLMRAILIGLIQNHRIELAALRVEPRPAPYRADDLDKELAKAGDVNGAYLLEDGQHHKRPRADVRPAQGAPQH